MSVTISVATEADLNQAIATADAAVSGSYTIVFDSTIVEGTDTGDLINGGTVDLSAPPDLYALNLAPGVSVTIDGAGFTLDGAGAYRGLFVYAGVVTIQDLTIANAHAVGGGGGYNAGGGAGLGGGLFVAGPDPAAYGRPDILTAGAQVTLDDVTFTDDAATGGNGGPNSGVGGGGGLGGAGGLSGGAAAAASARPPQAANRAKVAASAVLASSSASRFPMTTCPARTAAAGVVEPCTRTATRQGKGGAPAPPPAGSVAASAAVAAATP